jgi:hypothetical protein
MQKQHQDSTPTRHFDFSIEPDQFIQHFRALEQTFKPKQDALTEKKREQSRLASLIDEKQQAQRDQASDSSEDKENPFFFFLFFLCCFLAMAISGCLLYYPHGSAAYTSANLAENAARSLVWNDPVTREAAAQLGHTDPFNYWGIWDGHMDQAMRIPGDKAYAKALEAYKANVYPDFSESLHIHGGQAMQVIGLLLGAFFLGLCIYHARRYYEQYKLRVVSESDVQQLRDQKEQLDQACALLASDCAVHFSELKQAFARMDQEIHISKTVASPECMDLLASLIVAFSEGVFDEDFHHRFYKPIVQANCGHP